MEEEAAKCSCFCFFKFAVPNSLPPVKGATSKPQSTAQEEETAGAKTTKRGDSKTPQK